MSDNIIISDNQSEAASKLTIYLLSTIELLLKNNKPFITIGLSGIKLLKKIKTKNFLIFCFQRSIND